MRHKMLTQRALSCVAVMAKRVTLSRHFVTHADSAYPFLCCGDGKKGYTESAFCDAYRTSSAYYQSTYGNRICIS
jgi:hypothetical protein